MGYPAAAGYRGVVVVVGVKTRQIEFRTAAFRPVAMAAVYCPIVRDWDSGKTGPAWMGISHCNACAYVRQMHVDYEARAGEVCCAAE